MDLLAASTAVTPQIYAIGEQRIDAASTGFAQGVAQAHAERRRPRCMCLPAGAPMYIARLAGGFILKRMPGTGSRHAPSCPSYEPPADLSGLAQVLGSAIREDPTTGETTLKLDFALSKRPSNHKPPPPSSDSDRVVSDGTRLTLKGLLHFLWDQAELTRWQPGFAGKRSWAVVRRHLLQAATNKVVCGGPLLSRLYVPETFSVEDRDAINARRFAQWAGMGPGSDSSQQLLLLIGELKELLPARYGHKALIKHVPDLSFTLDERLYARLMRCCSHELSLWGAADDLHMMIIATFQVSEGLPRLAELSLMLVTEQWLPVEDLFERQLIHSLVQHRRSFFKALRYNLDRRHPVASAILTDTSQGPIVMRLKRGVADAGSADALADESSAAQDPLLWTWRTNIGPMPPLPT